MISYCPKCEKPFEYHLEDGIIFRECDCESVSPPMSKIPIMELFTLCIGSGTVPYKEPHKCACEKITTCWYKDDEWKTGFFHRWMQAYEEFECGPGHFPVAIIKDATDSRIHVVYAKDVSFSLDQPAPRLDATLKKTAEDYQRFQSSEEAKESQVINSESSDVEVEAAYQAMVEREGGDCSQGSECLNVTPYDPTPHYPKFDPRPANKSYRFRPQLKYIERTEHWAVQVHPEVIEMFNIDGDYLCQVRLIRGVMNYTQGGLPLKELEEMFQEKQWVYM